MSIWEETLGPLGLERLCLPTGLATPWDSPGGTAGSGLGEERLGCYTHDPNLDTRLEDDDEDA